VWLVYSSKLISRNAARTGVRAAFQTLQTLGDSAERTGELLSKNYGILRALNYTRDLRLRAKARAAKEKGALYTKGKVRLPKSLEAAAMCTYQLK
jgi:hypothetical protein